MSTTVTELVDAGERRDRKGRRISTAEQRAELVRQYRESGLTMAAFARNENIEYSTFAGWVIRSGRFEAPSRKIEFARAQLPAPKPITSLEVQLPDGTFVRGGSAVELAALIRALRA